MYAQDGTRHEDLLWKPGEAASVADYGVVGMTANAHPRHLLLLQLPGQARHVVRMRNVVVYESDLVPAMEARQQEPDIAFRA
jgi:hypothetical protein